VIAAGLLLAFVGSQANAPAGVARRPVAFVQPTSIELERSGTLLLVENSPGRILRVDPGRGQITVLASSVSRPYAIVKTATGRVIFSAADSLFRLGAGGRLVRLARTDSDIGPVAAGRDGA
jgi:hypothetical protein